VFLQFCANDLQSIMGGAITAGTSADGSEANSICGYVRKIISKIYEINPLARIYYLNLCDTQRIIDMVADAYSSYFEKNSWGTFDKDAMRSAWIDWQANVIPTIQEYGVQVINILEDIGLNSVTMPQITTNDYIHPNNDGHKRIFDVIAARIDTQTSGKNTPQSVDETGSAQLQLVQLTNVSPDMTTATSSKSSQEIYQDYLNGIITAVQIPATGNAVIMSQYTQDQIAALFLNMTDAVHYSLMQIKGTNATLTNIPEGVVQSWGLSKNWAGQVESGYITLANGKTINGNI
jgi:lysophospholipase L1-like esterase